MERGFNCFLGVVSALALACAVEPEGPDILDADAGPTGDLGPSGPCASEPEGAACDDGDPCTSSDVCSDGRCAGEAVVCESADPCMVGVCGADGACTLEPAADGTGCDDGDLCTRTDVCRAGQCVGEDALACDGSTGCVIGTCNPETGSCEGAAVADGTACESACVFNGSCRDGDCVGTPNVCPTGAECRSLVGCDDVLGCVYAPAADGLRCDDDSLCTSDDRCLAGACVGEAIRCPEAPECWDAICDPEVGCLEITQPDGTECEDDDACTILTECFAGECRATEVVECATGGCILSNTCNPATGFCDTVIKADGEPCDDLNLCTGGETCVGGSCEGGELLPWTEVPCADGVCFQDVTVAAGLLVANRPVGGLPGTYTAAPLFADFDGDGDPDIIYTDLIDGLHYYRNNGDGTFTDRTAVADFVLVETSTGSTHALAAGDYDADGDLDLYVAREGPNFLLQNDGKGVFTDVTSAAGPQVGDGKFSMGAVFGDYDADGDIDLYIANYIYTDPARPRVYPNHYGYSNRLLENDGTGKFTDVTPAKAISGFGPEDAGTTLVTAMSDYDGDGDLDLFDCNDFGQTIVPNQLFENDGSGGFTEVGAARGLDSELFCMGIAIGDFDRDLDLDYYMTSIGRHELLENRGSLFVDVAATRGVQLEKDDCEPHLKAAGWGTSFQDFDNDGWLDLFVANGWLQAAPEITNALKTENKLLLNQGGGRAFLDASRSSRIATGFRSRGVAFADYDLDGDIDILVGNADRALELWRNDSPNNNGAVFLELRGQESNPRGRGTWVEADIPGATLLREVGTEPAYQTQGEPIVHIGIGTALQIDELRLKWLSGIEQRLVHVVAGARLEVVEPLVTVDFVSAPTSIRAGQTITVSVTLEEEAGRTRTADLSVELQDSDGVPLVTQSLSQAVSGGARLSLDVDITAPPVVGSEGLILVVSSEDAEGGLDQWSRTLVRSP